MTEIWPAQPFLLQQTFCLDITAATDVMKTNSVFWYRNTFFFNSIEIFIWFTQFKVLRSEIADGEWNTIHGVLLTSSFTCIHFFVLFTVSKDRKRELHTLKMKLQSMCVTCELMWTIHFFFFDFMPRYRKLNETNRLMLAYAVYSVQKNKIWTKSVNHDIFRRKKIVRVHFILIPWNIILPFFRENADRHMKYIL